MIFVSFFFLFDHSYNGIQDVGHHQQAGQKSQSIIVILGISKPTGILIGYLSPAAY